MESVFAPAKNRKGLTFATDCVAPTAFRTSTLLGYADLPLRG